MSSQSLPGLGHNFTWDKDFEHKKERKEEKVLVEEKITARGNSLLC